MPVTVTVWAPTWDDAGVKDEIVGVAGRTVKLPDVPLPAAALTVTTPFVAPTGTTALIVVSLETVKPAALPL